MPADLFPFLKLFHSVTLRALLRLGFSRTPPPPLSLSPPLSRTHSLTHSPSPPAHPSTSNHRPSHGARGGQARKRRYAGELARGSAGAVGRCATPAGPSAGAAASARRRSPAPAPPSRILHALSRPPQPDNACSDTRQRAGDKETNRSAVNGKAGKKELGVSGPICGGGSCEQEVSMGNGSKKMWITKIEVLKEPIAAKLNLVANVEYTVDVICIHL